jgi:D-glycero-D-manno-heptose 1,7-bisphosphate phosphatase
MTHAFLIDGIGLWAQQITRVDFNGRPAVFLDRDGVIAEEVHFLADRKDVRLTLGIGEAIAALNQISVAVVVVTNQSGIARGRFGWSEFSTVQDEIAGQLARAGGVIDAAFACGYHHEGEGALGVADHPWRKPRPGMFWEASKLLGVDLPNSFVIGDRLSDLEAGCDAGVGAGAIVRTGYGEGESEGLAEAGERWRTKGFSVCVADNAREAIRRWARAGRVLTASPRRGFDER